MAKHQAADRVRGLHQTNREGSSFARQQDHTRRHPTMMPLDRLADVIATCPIVQAQAFDRASLIANMAVPPLAALIQRRAVVPSSTVPLPTIGIFSAINAAQATTAVTPVQRVKIGGSDVTEAKHLAEKFDVPLDTQQVKEMNRILADHESSEFDNISDFLALERVKDLIDPELMHGGFKGTHHLSFARRDSKGNLFENDGEDVIKELRQKSIEFHKARGKLAKPTTNYVGASITLNYRIDTTENKNSKPIFKQLSSRIDKHWISGAIQPPDDQDGDPIDAKGRLEAFVKSDRMTNRSGVFIGLTSEKYRALSKKDKREHKGSKYAESGDDVSYRPEPHAHSEVAFVTDPQLKSFFGGAFEELANKMEAGSVLITLTLDVDSFPNTMCMNTCRTALGEAYDKFDEKAAEYTESIKKSRVSGAFGTILRVSAQKEFLPNYNHKLHAFINSPPQPILEIGGAKTMLETTPRSFETRKVKERRDDKGNSDNGAHGSIPVDDGEESQLKKQKLANHSNNDQN